MKRLMLMATLISVAACDFDAEYDRLWCERHPTTPERCDGGSGTTDAGTDAGTPDAGTPDAGTPDAGTPDAGTPDAGTPDAGTPDAGTPDAGTPDAGTTDAGTTDAGTTDAGVQCAGRMLRIDTVASADAYECTSLVVQVMCDDDPNMPAPLTRSTTLTFTSHLKGTNIPVGHVFEDEQCNMRLTQLDALASLQAVHLSFNTAQAGSFFRFGEFEVRVAASDVNIAPVSVTVARTAHLVVEGYDGGRINAPRDAGCVPLPKPQLRSVLGSRVSAPIDTPVEHALGDLVACGPGAVISTGGFEPSTLVTVSPTALGLRNVTVSVAGAQVTPATLTVFACLPSGMSTQDLSQCCDGGVGLLCL